MRKNGFTVTTEVVTGNVINQVRRDNNIGPTLNGCHLAKIDGYFVEGHVPADLVARMLNEQEDFAGLSVPGMQGGSPGMEHEAAVPYRVLAFDDDGQMVKVYDRR